MNLPTPKASRRVLIVLAGLSILAAGSPAWGQDTQPADQPRDTETFVEQDEADETGEEGEVISEEITVTAQKREEALTEVPISITAISGSILEEQRANTFEDLVPLVPGLSLETPQPGQTRITLRGINTGGAASTVGVYVDDVPFGSSSGLAEGAALAGDFDTFDLDRVEVLRGPQGTLYGASALGGVIKYVQNQPTTEGFEGRFRASLEDVTDGDIGYSLTGLVNVPLSDEFAIRASGFYRFDDGFIDSIGNNPIPSLTDPANNVVDGTLVEDNVNSLDQYGGRIAALFVPSDRFSLTLRAQIQKMDSNGSNEIDGDPDTLEPVESGRVHSVYNPAYVDTEYQIYSATLGWELGAGTLESVTSYGTLDQELQIDAAIATGFTGGPDFAALVTALFGDPATRPLSVVSPQTTSTDKFTQELRFVSPASPTFDWLVGLYYTDEDSLLDQKILASEAGTNNIATDLPELVVVAVPSKYEEIAIFGNATWHATERFDLSFGARQSDNDQTASQLTEGLLIGGEIMFEDTMSSESPFTWSISPLYKLADESSVYARVATGFRPGGPNLLLPGTPPDVPRTYDSDSLTSYEVGYKMISADRKYSLDLSAFYQDWEDIQLITVVNDFGVNANGGTAESKGLEFTGSVFPTTGLTLSLNGAYTDAFLTQDTDPVIGGMDGDPLPWVPEWSFGFNGDYQWAVMADSLAYVGGTIGYVGDRTGNFNDRASDGDLLVVPSYTTVNLRAGIHKGRWSIEVYGKNLTDEMGITDLTGPGFLPNGAVGLGLIQPRTIGVSLGTSWWRESS